MIGVFDSVIFYIAPPTARRIGDNSEKMASMLRTGNAVYKSIIDDDVTHVICDSSDFGVTRKLVSDSVFCSFVTPKWVFISNSLHYSLPVVSTGFRSYSSDPFHYFSGLVFYFCNCSIPLNQVYLPLCIHHGAQVLTSIMSQCTHVIVFNSTQSTDLPAEVYTFPQIRVVSEGWIEACIHAQQLVDETEYLVKPVNAQDASVSFYVPNTQFVYEWEHDIQESVNKLFQGCPVEYKSAFKVKLIVLFYFFLLPERLFLSYSIELMGGKVLPFLNTLERTISEYISPRSSQGPLTHIICPYLKSGQRRRLVSILGNYPVSILSSNWLYSCIDQYSRLSTTQLNPWDSILFFPTPKSILGNLSFIPEMRSCIISITGFSMDSSPTREEVKCAIDTVGGCYMGPLCKDFTTHLICGNEQSDKYVAARLWKSNLKIVSVEWLLACLKTWSRVDEESYLLKEKKEANEDEISTADEEGSESEMSAALNGVTPASPVVVPVQEPSSPVPVPFVPSIPSAPVQEPPSSVLQSPPSSPIAPDESQLLAPQSMLASMAATKSEPLQPLSEKRPLDESSVSSKRPTLTPRNEESLMNSKVFLLSSEGLEDATEIITQLGGRVIQTHDTFSPEATHFIIPSPKRTEKYLGAVACGMWILRPEYLTASKAVGRWVNEEEYEWCTADSKSNITGTSIRRLRKEGGTVFRGAKIVLVGSLLPASDKWERIITGGGGSVAITKGTLTQAVKRLIYSADTENALKLCILPDGFKENKLVKTLQEEGYLLDLLSKDPVPNLDDYRLFK
ncbi:hypothetical protein JH06_3800 [Blastocystis sp. subtype 4]|uniref:hypothetical protein n=1 Tax=Blastocystis sp. subtype 4 TaxID=944170 RepID=UPI0007113B7C|nr:hypothetical protein JH06_3800 [Blastocystis sp. subtype 4]KNB42549.1 hypothetical protein JH06_3800 [Blastocystis sp. subtype 4]|eukprot:XP_014525992.1 hypothetical protein JH06_3800 [Blastocystis sp. subtype 4]